MVNKLKYSIKYFTKYLTFIFACSFIVSSVFCFIFYLVGVSDYFFDTLNSKSRVFVESYEKRIDTSDFPKKYNDYLKIQKYNKIYKIHPDTNSRKLLFDIGYKYHDGNRNYTQEELKNPKMMAQIRQENKKRGLIFDSNLNLFYDNLGNLNHIVKYFNRHSQIYEMFLYQMVIDCRFKFQIRLRENLQEQY
jgi:hypothetical protein